MKKQRFLYAVSSGIGDGKILKEIPDINSFLSSENVCTHYKTIKAILNSDFPYLQLDEHDLNDLHKTATMIKKQIKNYSIFL